MSRMFHFPAAMYEEPTVELCLGLIARLAAALRELSDGAGCDHETGICYCAEAALLEEAAAFAGGQLCRRCKARVPTSHDGYCCECVAEFEAPDPDEVGQPEVES